MGDQAPLGFWDPLGLSADKDVEVFKRPGGMLDTHETYDATVPRVQCRIHVQWQGDVLSADHDNLDFL